MRQAGRSLPEYRIARADTTILEACLQPDLAAEITLQPVRRHGVDAAIFFSDIMTPLVLAGVDVEIVSGIGPVVENPIRTAADVDRITGSRIEDLSAITEAVRPSSATRRRSSASPVPRSRWPPTSSRAAAPATTSPPAR